MVIVNKVSDVTAAQRDLVLKVVRALNPDAHVIETDFARVDLDEVLDTAAST